MKREAFAGALTETDGSRGRNKSAPGIDAPCLHVENARKLIGKFLIRIFLERSFAVHANKGRDVSIDRALMDVSPESRYMAAGRHTNYNGKKN